MSTGIYYTIVVTLAIAVIVGPIFLGAYVDGLLCSNTAKVATVAGIDMCLTFRSERRGCVVYGQSVAYFHPGLRTPYEAVLKAFERESEREYKKHDREMQASQLAAFAQEFTSEVKEMLTQ